MDKFFRDYLTMKLTRIPKQGRVYDEFKLYHLNCEFSTIRELCQDLLTYAKYYTDIVFAVIRFSKDFTLTSMTCAWKYPIRS